LVKNLVLNKLDVYTYSYFETDYLFLVLKKKSFTQQGVAVPASVGRSVLLLGGSVSRFQAWRRPSKRIAIEVVASIRRALTALNSDSCPAETTTRINYWIVLASKKNTGILENHNSKNEASSQRWMGFTWVT
jgi:hypothetical protein